MGLMAMLGCLAALPGVNGQSLDSRLRGTKNRQETVRDNLKDVKAQQEARRKALSAARGEADRAQAAYGTAKSTLEATRKHLKQARTKLDQFTQRMDRHGASVNQRIRLMYEIGEPSYVEVLLDASTFSDFVERADYMQRVAQNDANQLIRFAGELREVDTLRHGLEQTQAQEEDEARKLNATKADAEQKEDQAWALAKQSSDTRARYEGELADLDREEKALEALLAESRRAIRQGGLAYAGTYSGWASQPIKSSHRFTSPFGRRFHPILRRWKHHAGVDLACSTGTRIYAAAKGRVVVAGYHNGVIGNCVIIDHGSGWSTIYGHMSRVGASRGQHVAPGDVVGYVGSTGRSTGPHLHFGVAKNGSCVDPIRAGAYRR